MKSRVSGVVLLELLVGLGIILPVLFGFAAALHSSVYLNARVKLEHRNLYTFLKVRNLIRKVSEDLDSHTFNLPPRIHQNGQITYTDGTDNKVATSAHPPLPDSTAITGISLALPYTQRVIKTVPQGDAVVFFACARFKEKLSRDLYKSYLGISADGFFELSGSFEKSPGKKSCRIFVLKPEKSMTAPLRDLKQALLIRLLIPVGNHYTLYVDRSYQLRFLAHRGSRNIENQPLIKGIKTLILRSSPVDGTSLREIGGLLELPGGFQKEFSLINRFARQSHYSLLLNRP